MSSQSELVLKPEDDTSDQIKPLEEGTIKKCGEMLFVLFGSQLINEDTYDDVSTISTTTFSNDTSYMDLLMLKRFDRFYDMMVYDLQKVDSRYQVLPKLQLYDDLNGFILDNELHKINRYVFGDGPSQNNWDPSSAAELKTVRTWRKQFKDQTSVPESLVNIYETASAREDLCPFDVGMITFAVFGFLLGYDTSKDYDILYNVFRRVESFTLRLNTFQHVYNTVLRHVYFHPWMFFDETTYEKDIEYFDSTMENPDVKAVFEWIFYLLADDPEIIEKFRSNPFPIDKDITREMYDANGVKMTSSYIVQLRIFYRWMSKQMYLLLSGRYHNRISLLDSQIKQLSKYIGKTTGLRYFNDMYNYVFRHLLKILSEHNCPESMLKTVRDTCTDEKFKSIIQFCVMEQVNYNLYLTHRESSTNSNVSIRSHSDSSQINGEETE